MPTRTVDKGFRDFLQTLTPTTGESQAAKNHRASIEACLKKNFSMTRFFRTGSLGNGTSISGYSDVDYFAEIPHRNLHRISTYTMVQIRHILNRRFPKTRVRVSCPAILIRFGNDAKESTEITPANYLGVTTRDKYEVYEIPDCSDGWMRSSPDAHNAYVRAVDRRLGGRVKHLIRFIKAWKYYQNVPISSFYLELRVAKYAEGKSSITYDLDVKGIFSHLYNIQLAGMQDPMRISGYVHPCSTPTMLKNAKSKLTTALSRAQNACNAKTQGQMKKAFYYWGLLYNRRFPKLYYY